MPATCVSMIVLTSHTLEGTQTLLWVYFIFLLYTLYETSILLYVASLGPGWPNFRPSKWQ